MAPDQIKEIQTNELKGCDYERDIILAQKINELIRNRYKKRRKPCDNT